METVALVAVSIVVGLLIGVLSGLLGVGGGTILVPVFNLGYAMSAIASTATSLFTIIPTSLTGSIAHIRNKTCIPRLGIAAGIGGAVMSPVGVWLASMSPDWATMVAAALVIGYSAITMFGKAIKLKRSTKEKPKTEEVAVQEEFKAEPKKMYLVGILVGLFAGVVSGYVGVGGGFIMIPVFMQVLGTPMKLTSGTSLIAVMFISIPGAITQALLGNIHWLAGISIAIGSVPGAAIGSKLITRVPELTLRFGFAAFLVVAALMLAIKQFI